MKLYVSSGDTLEIGRQIGRGGEGAVYEVVGRPNEVAKIYHEVLSSEKAVKLKAMIRLAVPQLLESAAWPTETLHRARDGAPVGFVMAKVTGFREIHTLYSPAHRKQEFPNANWKFLVVSARNVANVFASLHAAGHVIGDVNQGNVVVSSRATVKLIDCDSFQIVSEGRQFLCEVGVGHFTPPELQGRRFSGLVRTPNHDRFGLAVLCFHLLFAGRHPYAGRFLGTGDMPIEKAIREFRFAFSRSSTSRMMNPPPSSLPLEDASPKVAALFEQAFGVTGVQGGRPTAGEWVSALDALRGQLKICSQHPGHTYYEGLSRCPWCVIQSQGGPDLFIAVNLGVRFGSGFDIIAIWATIAAVEPPLPASQTPGLPGPAGVIPAPLPVRVRRVKIAVRILGWSAIAAVVALMMGLTIPGAGLVPTILGIGWLLLRLQPGYATERKRRREAAATAEHAFSQIKQEWERGLGDVVHRFGTRMRDLEAKRTEYTSLPGRYQAERTALERQREAAQRRRFLERYFIEKHRIPKIGPGLKATLASYGIETAADVSSRTVSAIPGFGATRTKELLLWRQGIERRFAFDPAKGVDPADVRALDLKFASRRQELEQALRQGRPQLYALRAEAEQKRSALTPQFLRLAQTLEQAKADAKAA